MTRQVEGLKVRLIQEWRKDNGRKKLQKSYMKKQYETCMERDLELMGQEIKGKKSWKEDNGGKER